MPWSRSIAVSVLGMLGYLLLTRDSDLWLYFANGEHTVYVYPRSTRTWTYRGEKTIFVQREVELYRSQIDEQKQLIDST